MEFKNGAKAAPIHNAELAVSPEDKFRADIDRLATIANTFAESDLGADTTFYRVEWGKAEPTHIKDIRLMRAYATGARRQEIDGLFQRAQFVTVLMDEAGVESGREYEWYDTYPQTLGTPIVPVEDAFYDQSGYRVLSLDNVLQDVIENSSTPEEYLIIAQACNDYGVEQLPELVKAINSLVLRLVFNQQAPNKSPQSQEQAMDRGLQLLQELKATDAELSKATQGRLVSRLLRTMAQSWATKAPSEMQNTAAYALSSALEQGIIESRPRTVMRILSTMAVYRYPFATDLLHAELTAENYENSTGRFYSMWRDTFAHDYMLMVLADRTRADVADDHPAAQFLGIVEPIHYSRADVSFRPILMLANQLEGREDVTDIDDNATVHEAFQRILLSLRSDDPEIAAQQAKFDKKCVKNIEVILRQVDKINRKDLSTRRYIANMLLGLEIDEDEDI